MDRSKRQKAMGTIPTDVLARMSTTASHLTTLLQIYYQFEQISVITLLKRPTIFF